MFQLGFGLFQLGFGLFQLGFGLFQLDFRLLQLGVCLLQLCLQCGKLLFFCFQGSVQRLKRTFLIPNVLLLVGYRVAPESSAAALLLGEKLLIGAYQTVLVFFADKKRCVGSNVGRTVGKIPVQMRLAEQLRPISGGLHIDMGGIVKIIRSGAEKEAICMGAKVGDGFAAVCFRKMLQNFQRNDQVILPGKRGGERVSQRADGTKGPDIFPDHGDGIF